jgi:LacI family transcriptional regulator
MPVDVGFATFDELTVDDLLEPSITTIVQPAFQIGSIGAEALLNRIGNREPPAILTVGVDASLKIRESSRQRSSLCSRHAT